MKVSLLFSLPNDLAQRHVFVGNSYLSGLQSTNGCEADYCGISCIDLDTCLHCIGRLRQRTPCCCYIFNSESVSQYDFYEARHSEAMMQERTLSCRVMPRYLNTDSLKISTVLLSFNSFSLKSHLVCSSSFTS